VFYPGAKVDPRAYVGIFRPIAAAGFPVVILRLPVGIAFGAPDAASRPIAANPSIPRWVVAGHSLGGTVAAAYAGAGHERVVGLVLWASYPARSIAGAAGLRALSVSASNDGLATPAKITASRPDLPPGTTFVEVVGAVHADFGDYGPQQGDGVPTISHEEAQRRIVAATLAFLRTVDAG
jgi:pimeloyl-ACP methyl ester carboxylesterase